MSAKRLFICYARVDSVAVQALATECQQLGQNVWFDQQLSGGQQWWDTILENIRSCDCFVFALSLSSLRSKACRAELDDAHALHRPILPVAVGDVVPDQLLPPYAAQTQRVDPSQPIQLARALLSLGLAPPFEGPQPLPPPVPISYLDELADVVDRRELTLAEQRNIVADPKGRLSHEDERDGAKARLQRLRQRSDVYNSVAAEIDEVITSLPPPDQPTDDRPREQQPLAAQSQPIGAPRRTGPHRRWHLRGVARSGRSRCGGVLRVRARRHGHRGHHDDHSAAPHHCARASRHGCSRYGRHRCCHHRAAAGSHRAAAGDHRRSAPTLLRCTA